MCKDKDWPSAAGAKKAGRVAVRGKISAEAVVASQLAAKADSFAKRMNIVNRVGHPRAKL